jgi:hypothetical protein
MDESVFNGRLDVTVRIEAFETENLSGAGSGYLTWPVYWRNIGTASALDFTVGGINVNEGALTLARQAFYDPYTGAFIRYENIWQSTITFLTVSDLTTEGPETIQIAVYQTQSSPTAEATGNVVTISDTSVTQSVIISHNYVGIAGAPNEITSRSLVISVYTLTSFPAGQRLYWDVTGDVTSADFNSSALTGSWIPSTQFYTSDIPGYRLWRISFSIKEDQLTEGPETMIFNVRVGADPVANPPIAGSAYSITINDTSQTRFLSISPSSVSIDEGQTLSITITSNNWPVGTAFSMSTKNISGNFNDSFVTIDGYADVSYTGLYQIDVTSDPFTYTTPPMIISKLDNQPYEGPEQFVLQLHKKDFSGQDFSSAIANIVRATSPVITINDTGFRLTAVFRLLYATPPYSTNGQVDTPITVFESTASFDSVVYVYFSINQLPVGSSIYWSAVGAGSYSSFFNAVRDTTNYDNQSQNGGGTLTYNPAASGQQLLRILIKNSAATSRRSFSVRLGPNITNPSTYGSSAVITIAAN